MLTAEDITIDWMDWVAVDHPSAEGQSFSMGIYRCQILASGNVNGLNAGLTISPDLHVWTEPCKDCKPSAQGGTLYLGKCKGLGDFIEICKFLNIS